MMRMQTEGEVPMELNALLPQQHVACGGAARTLDVKEADRGLEARSRRDRG